MVQILEANPNVGWGSIGAAFGGGLGQGLQEARQMTMADKMQVLKQQRELQAQEQKLSMIDKQFPGMGNAVRAVGPQGAAMIIKEYGPEGISRIFGPQAQFQAPRTTALSGLQQEIPYEDREAIEEAQEFPSAQRLEGYPGEMAVKKRPLPEREITSLDEYRRKIAPNYDQLGKTAKESVDRRAEREFNAAMSLRKEAREEKAPETARLNKEIDRLEGLRASGRKKTLALEEMKRMNASDASGFYPYLINKMGLDPFIKPESAQFMAAGKEFFLGNIGRVGSRPNQWIEQQIMEMMPKIGRSKIANDFVIETLQADTDIDQKEVQLMDEFREKYPKQPEKLIKEKNKALDSYVVKRQKQLAYNLQSLKEKDQKVNSPDKFNALTKVPDNTPLTIEKAQMILNAAKGDEEKAIRIAKALGYNPDYLLEE